MDTLQLALIVGSVLGLLFTINQSNRMSRNPNRFRTNEDGSVKVKGRTLVIFFVLWSTVFSILSFIPIALIKLVI